jgi:uncharacterized coiled-coil protein SlyX|tara:strand:- start:3244 stop:3765 length:522 start_codon:yes stop_codon:yes gene_type:complete
MLQKIKDNLAIVVTAITLMGSIGAGIQSLGAVLTTLSNIDERMNSIEYRFEELRSETMVSNDIATLYEKVNQLEQISYEADQFRDQIVYLNAEFQNLDKRLSDLEWKVDDFQNRYISDLNNPSQDSQSYELMKWEWQDLLKKITTLENNQLESWEFDNLRDRIAYLEAYSHQH